MKKTDVAMVILIAAVSVGIAYFVVGSLPFLAAPTESVPVKQIDKYSADADEPDPVVFNDTAINPTVQVTIGQNPDGQ